MAQWTLGKDERHAQGAHFTRECLQLWADFALTGQKVVSQIETYAREVAKRFRPERIILFGSHAYGRPGPDSDVDLLVIMDHPGRPPYQEAKIRTTVRVPFAVDLMVRTPSRLKRRLSMKDSFITEIAHKGRVLHNGRNKKAGHLISRLRKGTGGVVGSGHKSLQFLTLRERQGVVPVYVTARRLRSTARSIWPGIKALDNRLGVMERTPS